MADRCPSCPVRPGLDCLGAINPGACVRQATDAPFRSSLVRRALVLAAWPRVQSCPARGPVLPVSALSGGCCGGGPELTRCGANRGPADRPDAVSIDECTACVSGNVSNFSRAVAQPATRSMTGFRLTPDRPAR